MHRAFGLTRASVLCSILQLDKRKSTENQLISVLCGVLPFLIVTPEISG